MLCFTALEMFNSAQVRQTQTSGVDGRRMAPADRLQTRTNAVIKVGQTAIKWTASSTRCNSQRRFYTLLSLPSSVEGLEKGS